jgi:hypothetical protein
MQADEASDNTHRKPAITKIPAKRFAKTAFSFAFFFTDVQVVMQRA